MADSYNIFEELGLTPPQTPQAVMAALDKKIDFWNKQRNRRGEVARQKWEYFKGIKAQLSAQPGLIAQHAAQFADIAKAKRRDQEQRLRLNAAIYVVGGQIEEAQLRRLQQENPDLTEQEILGILGATIKKKRVISPQATDDPSVKETDPMVLKRIAEQLAIVGARDLYDYLKVSQNAPASQISQIADRLYTESQTTGDLNSRTVRAAIVGLVKTVLLADPKTRAGYDKALANQVFAPVREQIQAISMGTAKVITPEQYKALLQSCTRAGVPQQKAEAFLWGEAERRGLTIVEGNTDTRVCRFCGTINPRTAALCGHCAMPLEVTCPRCGAKSDSAEELRCTRCGFAIGEMPRALDNIKAARQALTFGNTDEASRLMRLAAEQWPGHKDLDGVQKQVDQALRAASEALRAVAAQVEQRRYYGALAALKGLTGPEADRLRATAQSACSRADALMASLPAAKGNDRLSLCLQALEIAADCAAATDTLRRTPPTAPAQATATASGRNIKVQWTTGGDSGFIRYKVVRRQDARPSSPTDGTEIGCTAGSSIDDTTATAGCSYYYGVYALCGDIHSASAAVTARPVLIAADIEPRAVGISADERQIAFTFTLPPHATGIDLWRDGVQVKTGVSAAYTDTPLQCGRTYRYRIVATYRDAAGATVASAGIEMPLTPVAPPKPVTLTLGQGSGADTLRLSWSNPPAGTVNLYYSDEAIDYVVGQKVAVDTLRMHPVSHNGGWVELKKDFCALRRYLPVTVIGGTGVVGKGVELLNVKPVASVRIERNDGYVNASWQWHGTNRVRLTWQADSGRTQSRDIPRTEPPQMRLPYPEGTSAIKVSIAAVISTPQGDMLSEPTEQVLTLKATRLEFRDLRSEAKFGLFNTDAYSVTLLAQGTLPSAISVLTGEGTVPADLVNTSPAAVIPPADITPGCEVKIPFKYSRRDKSRPLYVRIIATDRKAATLISITPESRKLK